MYVSGTGASNDDTGTIKGKAEATAFDETKSALENIDKILAAVGSSTERIVNAQMLLTNKDDYAECNRAYVEYFAERGLADKLPSRGPLHCGRCQPQQKWHLAWSLPWWKSEFRGANIALHSCFNLASSLNPRSSIS